MADKAAPTRSFTVPLTFKHLDPNMVRFEIDASAHLKHGFRGRRIMEFNTAGSGFPGDFDLMAYEVSGKISVEYTVTKKPNK